MSKEPFINLIINGHELAAFFANEKLFIKKGRVNGYAPYNMDRGVLYENTTKKVSKDYSLK